MVTTGNGRPIVLITIDSLRADHLGAYGYGRNTSPHIDALAAQGVRYAQAISNGGGTPEAFPSILGGVSPPIHWQEYREIFRHRPTIAHILRDAGYETAAFHSNPYLSRWFHYHRGFDLFDDGMTKLTPEQAFLLEDDWPQRARGIFRLFNRMRSLYRGWSPPIVKAEDLNEKVISWLRARSRKFFLWIHYMDVHYPYKPPPLYLRLLGAPPVNSWRMLGLYYQLRRNPHGLSPRDLQILVNLYDACIRYVDDAIGSLLAELQKKWPEAAIVLTADHGDAFGDHGRFSHDSLYEELLRVPLVVAGGGTKSGTVVAEQVSLRGISDAILSLVGLGRPGLWGGSQAVSTASPVPREERVFSVCLNPSQKRRLISCRTEGWKYIRIEDMEAGCLVGEELYYLKADPRETRNVVEDEPDKAQEFRVRVDGFLAATEQKRSRTLHEMERIAKRVRRLKSLGGP